MTKERWKTLMNARDKESRSPLSQDESGEGWHWCPYWDYLLVGPGMELELASCQCKEDCEQRLAEQEGR